MLQHHNSTPKYYTRFLQRQRTLNLQLLGWSFNSSLSKRQNLPFAFYPYLIYFARESKFRTVERNNNLF